MRLPTENGAPTNLSRHALRDVIAVLRRSKAQFGRSVAEKTGHRLLRRFRDIEQGTAVGHLRPEIDGSGRTLFLTEPPWVIAYDRGTRQILRVLHGARDLPSLMPGNDH